MGGGPANTWRHPQPSTASSWSGQQSPSSSRNTTFSGCPAWPSKTPAPTQVWAQSVGHTSGSSSSAAVSSHIKDPRQAASTSQSWSDGTVNSGHQRGGPSQRLPPWQKNAANVDEPGVLPIAKFRPILERLAQDSLSRISNFGVPGSEGVAEALVARLCKDVEDAAAVARVGDTPLGRREAVLNTFRAHSQDLGIALLAQSIETTAEISPGTLLGATCAEVEPNHSSGGARCCAGGKFGKGGRGDVVKSRSDTTWKW